MPLEIFLQNNKAAFDSELPKPKVWESIRQKLDTTDTDPLVQFIAKNRLAFDEQTPAATLIDRMLPSGKSPLAVSKKPSAYSPAWWLHAAAVLLLIGAGLFAGRTIGYQAAQDDYLAVISQIQPDFPEAEAYYQQNIAAMSAVVYQQTPDPRLITDLEDMDRAIKELRQELLQVPRQQQATVVADLIKTYRIKLEILQNILTSLPEKTDASNKTQAYENDEI